MKHIVITGIDGFIGKNLAAHLRFRQDISLEGIRSDEPADSFRRKLLQADVVFHLAGVNRPQRVEEFETGNLGAIQRVLQVLSDREQPTRIVISSSTQATMNNSYGRSKLAAEQTAEAWCNGSKHELVIFRLPGVFGKWSRPNYNTVVATFCHNITRDLPIQINDPSTMLQLIYIDDVVKQFLLYLDAPVNVVPDTHFHALTDVYSIALGDLAEKIQSFKTSRQDLYAPAVGEPLVKNLYSTYLSFLPKTAFSYPMELKTDNRGSLFEWIKNPAFGQVFVSVTKPGVTRGNHFHHTKTEKFLIIQGQATVNFRKIDTEEIIKYPVSGEVPTVVDIPPGYTHNLVNTGNTDLIALFWANEIFDPQRPDTQFLEV